MPNFTSLLTRCALAAGLLAGGWSQVCAADEDAAAKEKHFEEKIRPILVEKCLECHGPKKQESDLRLDSRPAIVKGGASGETVANPDNAAESQLIKALQYTGDLQMPPDAKLSDEQIRDFAKWIEQGFVWPNSTQAVLPISAAQRVAEHRQSHWAFQPVARPISSSLPAFREQVQGALDELVAANLAAKGLTFSPEADRRTLYRRLSFDLLGLPPRVEDVEAFVADPAPDAYERVVDRLLASPQFGERWARHWMDVARYADTRGYAFQQDRRYPYAYTYRDYIIRAFNEDLPYDRFIVEQLAADRLDLKEDKRALAALGFLTVGRKFNNGQDDLDDQIDVVSRGLLGLTIACARCHDHKFDAVPTEDYYSLYGVFASSKQPNDLPIIGPPAAGDTDLEAYEKELNKRKEAVVNFERDTRNTIVNKVRDQIVEYMIQAAAPEAEEKPRSRGQDFNRDDIRPLLVTKWRKWLREQTKPGDATFGLWHELTALSREEFEAKAPEILQRWSEKAQGFGEGELNPNVKAAFAESPPKSHPAVGRLYGNVMAAAYKQWKEAGGNNEAFDKLPPEARPLARAIAGSGTPTDLQPDEFRSFITRADKNKQNELQKAVDSYNASSSAAPPRAMVLEENAQPHNPHVFIRGNAGRPGKQVPRQFPAVLSAEQRQPFASGGRLELAQSIAARDNPLTPRVIVNRLWMNHSGDPLVSTPSDFGIRTEAPVELKPLDWLAFELVDERANWSLKHIHRLLVTSHTYRQSSLDRPDARAIDPENRLFWRMNRRRLEFEPLRDSLLAVSGQLDTKLGGRTVDLFKSPFTQRRAVYGYIDRQDLPNTFRVFDLASPDSSSPRRPQTSVPQQSLFLMNSPFVQQSAEGVIRRVPASEDAAQRIVELYREVFARPPNEQELAIGLRFVTSPDDGEKQEADKIDRWTQFAQLLLLTNEFTYVD